MRITTITSSIASVVSRVIDVVASAGAVRTFLHLTLMREHLGSWQAPCQFEFAYASNCSGYPRANPMPGKPGGECRLRHSDMYAPTVCTTQTRLTSVRATRCG